MRRSPLSIAAILAVLGCGPTTTGQVTNNPTETINRGGALHGQLKTTATGYRLEVEPFEIPAGTEVMRCAVVQGLPEEALIQVTTQEQSMGGHHVAIFTNATAHPGDELPCQSSADMASFRFIAAPAFDGRPDNLAFKIPANKPFIVQAHYVNATMNPIIARDAFNMEKAPAGSNPRLADFFAFNDSGFLLPQGRHDLVVTCNIDKDIEVVQHFGHMHELGAHYAFEYTPAGGAPTMLDEYEWEKEFRDTAPLNAYTVANHLTFRTGDTLRMTCGYNNTSGHDVEFPEEMCVTFITYLTTADRPGGFMTCTNGAPEVLQ